MSRPSPALDAWHADLARCGERSFLREQSIWAITVYRFGAWADERRSAVARRVLDRLYWPLFRITEVLTGVSFTKRTSIGPGLRIHHFGNIFVNERSRIGADCTLRQGVTIGSVDDDGPAPVLGDRVELGAYAQVLGGVIVGDDARVGAMSVVLADVPAGCTVAGAPARVVSGGPDAPSASPPTHTSLPHPGAAVRTRLPNR